MAGYVCTLAGGKGGVGKTTTAINLGAILDSEGYDVVVVDADLGMANLAGLLDLEYEQSIHDVLAGEAKVGDALTTARGMTVVPGERSLEAFADTDPSKLESVIRTLRNSHEVVVVDTAAGLTDETVIPLGMADGIILLTTPDDVAITDIERTTQLIDRVDGTLLGALIARATAETDVDDIESRIDTRVLGAIPDDAGATAEEPLAFTAPDSDAADAYERLTGSLQHVFEGGDVDDVGRVFDPTWFGTAEESTESSPSDEEGDDGSEVDEDDDDDDYSHAVFRGI